VFRCGSSDAALDGIGCDPAVAMVRRRAAPAGRRARDAIRMACIVAGIE
jgi:hypothetical protein